MVRIRRSTGDPQAGQRASVGASGPAVISLPLWSTAIFMFSSLGLLIQYQTYSSGFRYYTAICALYLYFAEGNLNVSIFDYS